MLGNMVVPGIGAFVGFVLGALIGNLFGSKKPKTPTANAEVYLDYTSDQFQLGASSASNGGNLQLVHNMAEASRDTLNGFLTVLAGDMPYEATSWGNGLWRNGKYIASDAGLQSFYGHTGGQLWVKLGSPSASQQNVASADDAVSKGVMWSIKQTQIIGGDIFAKRALANSAATDLTALLGDLQIASDYRFYAENRELINGYITGAYNSLNQGEKDYYAAHKATIDKAHTQGVNALDGNELAFYNGNRATIDKIISALEDQAIANPWIITLQRINELKLDQWNSADFNGGLQGFLTSMGLESYGAYMENVRVTDLLGGMTLSVKGPTVQDGVFSILPQALDAPLNNDLLNPSWEQNMAGWQMTAHQMPNLDRGINQSGVWGSAENPTFYVHGLGTPAAGSYADTTSSLVSVEGGLNYDFSVLAAQHRSLGQAYVQFLDANKQHIDYSMLNGTAKEGGGLYGDLANLNVLSASFTAPINAKYVRLSFRMYSTGGNDPYAFFAQPTIRQSGGPAINWSQSGNAIRIDDLAKIGYTKLTDGNTAGRDFLDFSQRTAAVGWSDWSQQTHTNYVWNSHMQEYVEETQTIVTTGGDDIVIGSRFGDYLAGAAGWDWIDGGDGDDTIEGGDGNDVLLGGAGRDRLVGGGGDDYLVSGVGDDHPWFGDGYMSGMWGGDGNDTIVFNGGIDGGFGENGDDVFLMEQDGFLPGFEASGHYDGNQMDYVDAGAGSDTISYERFTAPFAHNLDVNFWPWATNTSAMPVGGINGVVVYLGNHPGSWNNGDAGWADARYIMGDWIKGVENVTGSRFNDYLWGDAGNNIIKGGDGNDFLDGHDGADILEGGAGADYMFGGGTGGDTASYEGSNAGVFINFTTGEAFGGHATGDKFHSIQHIRGSRFADELTGDAGYNEIRAGEGDDWIVATKGNDIYFGDEGLDTVDYSEGFASGYSTYQAQMGGGYWQWDDWLQQDVWVEEPIYYQTVSGYVTGLNITLGGYADWRATDGTVGRHQVGSDVEHIIGTAGDDVISIGGYEAYATGGKGNDALSGYGGSSTYYFNRGDGFDRLLEDNSGSNTLSFSGDVKVGDLGFGWQSHANGVFDIYIQGTGDHIQIQGNVQAVGNNKLKMIDFNGAGQLDVSQLTRMKVGGNGNDVVYGEPNGQSDLIAGYGGNDNLYGAPNNGWETQGNVFIGGQGADFMSASTGDDQYAFDVGDSYDTIVDTGGDDTLVFGSTVGADDVRVEVQGLDLVVFYNPGDNNDHVRIRDGGVRYHDVNYGTTSWNTVEFINAGGTWIDIRKLDIGWVDQYINNGGWAPIVLDLGDDGLDLIGVDQSQIVSRLDSGQLARTGWIGATDGILAVDRDGDGQINRLSEISFTQDKEGAKTDLEGLRTWDTNGDGKITVLDEGWSKLKVWVDRNQNGRSTDGELRTLEQAGITAIDLTGQGTGMTSAMTRDNFVHNTMSFTRADGRQGTAYDVNLARKLLQEKGLTREQVIAAWGAVGADGELGRLLNDPAAQALLAGTISETSSRASSTLAQKGLLKTGMLSAELTLDDGGADVQPIVTPMPAEVTLEDLLANTQVDFSDHDATYAEDEQRLRDKLEAALRGDDYVRTGEDVLGSSSGGQGVRGAFGHAFGRPNIEDEAAMPLAIGDQSEGQRSYAASHASTAQVGSAERVSTTGVDGRRSDYGQLTDIDQAANLLSAVSDADDVWAPAEFSRASIAEGRQWWRSAVVSPEDLPMLTPFASLDQASEIEGGGSQASASQHHQLVQALAAFGPKTGGGNSAIWKRSGEADAEGLAAVTSDNRWRFAGPSRIHA